MKRNGKLGVSHTYIYPHSLFPLSELQADKHREVTELKRKIEQLLAEKSLLFSFPVNQPPASKHPITPIYLTATREGVHGDSRIAGA